MALFRRLAALFSGQSRSEIDAAVDAWWGDL